MKHNKSLNIKLWRATVTQKPGNLTLKYANIEWYQIMLIEMWPLGIVSNFISNIKWI